MQTSKLLSSYYDKVIKVYGKYFKGAHRAMSARSWGIIWSKNDLIWDH